MENIKNNYEYLKLISNCKKQTRNKLINLGNKDQINSLCECILNTLNGNVKITNDQFKEYKKNKNILRNLVKKKSLKQKKKLLIQKGGFLTTLIPTVLSLYTLIKDATR